MTEGDRLLDSCLTAFEEGPLKLEQFVKSIRVDGLNDLTNAIRARLNEPRVRQMHNGIMDHLGLVVTESGAIRRKPS